MARVVGWALGAVALAVLAALAVSAGLDGLAYRRAWPTMSDGTVARAELVTGVVLAAGAAVSAWRAVAARRAAAG